MIIRCLLLRPCCLQADKKPWILSEADMSKNPTRNQIIAWVKAEAQARLDNAGYDSLAIGPYQRVGQDIV
jgi:hypothetical protein